MIPLCMAVVILLGVFGCQSEQWFLEVPYKDWSDPFWQNPDAHKLLEVKYFGPYGSKEECVNRSREAFMSWPTDSHIEAYIPMCVKKP